MRYSIHINQVRCLEWEIKPSLGGIVDLINQASSWAQASVINGFTYYWVEPSKVAEELIAEGWKRDTARRHMNTLKEKDIIDLVIMDGKYYVRLTEKGATWNQITTIRETEKNSSGEFKFEAPRKKIREGAEKNSPDKYIQDINNTKDQYPLNPPVGETQGEPKLVLEYLNDRLAHLSNAINHPMPKFKPVDSTLKNIKVRITESSVEDCRLVIDYLVAKWGRDVKMREHLTPKTIFKASNFAEYLSKATAWEESGRPVAVNGKWYAQAELEKRLIMPTVDEVRALFQKSLSGNPFKALDFGDKRNLVLYHATISTKNKRPLERDLSMIISQEIKNAVERIDQLKVPTFS